MTDEDAFLAAIKEDPDKDLPRLVFADWLEEQGQPERAELIRCQVEVHWPAAGYHRRVDLDRRARALLAEYGELWLGPWTGHGNFQRGLIQVSCRGSQFLKLVADGVRKSGFGWVEELAVDGITNPILSIIDAPWLQQIASLNLMHNRIGDAGLFALAAAINLARLTSLNLGYNQIGPIGARVLAESPHLTRLTTLNLERNPILDLGVKALVTSPHLAQLSHLNLANTGIEAEGVRALADSPYLVRLTTLNLYRNNIGDADAQALAASPRLAGCTSLDLRRNNIGAEVATQLRKRFGAAVLL